jgi:hypothetical protein
MFIAAYNEAVLLFAVRRRIRGLRLPLWAQGRQGPTRSPRAKESFPLRRPPSSLSSQVSLHAPHQIFLWRDPLVDFGRMPVNRWRMLEYNDQIYAILALFLPRDGRQILLA